MAKLSSESTLRFTDLWDYQHRAIQFVREKFLGGFGGCALWLDMGLGKTIIVLTALLDLMIEFEVGKVLVIAPLRVARKTWQDEVNAWAHTRGLRVSHIIGSPQERRAAMEVDADIYCINRENTQWLVNEHAPGRTVIKPWKWDVVVLDESSSFKSRSAKRWQKLRKVRRLINFVIELTGTPSPNGLMDLWAQVYLLDQGERLGKTLTAFRDRWFDPPGYNQFKWTPKAHAEQEVMEKLNDICLTLREEDYLELPPVIRNYIPAYLTPEQWDQYRTLERHYVVEINEKDITAVNAGVLAGKLLQLANGAVYTMAPAWEEFHRGKIEVLLEILEQADGPVMVCYNFKSDLARIKAALTKAKLDWDLLSDTQSEDRWNAGETEILLLHPGSAGHGLNLHHSGSETLVWFGLNWSLELYQQANARLIGGHRRKDRNVVIHHIVAEGTMDDDVVDALNDKDATQERILNAMKQRVLSYAK
jgi:SNF2 family DNA or RNA helicase